MKRRIKILIGASAALLAGIAYYGLSPLWRSIVLDESMPEDTIVVVDGRVIVPTTAHPASGTVSLLQSGTQQILRYENFKTINGPDLKVYLSSDLDATEFVDLGPLKATEGNVNYTVPPGTDVHKYRYALVWCEQFGVLFNSVDLQQ
jgi:Electron transfer DM13